MKTQLIRLADDDQKARDLLRENVDACAYDHILSKKLRDRFSIASGAMTAAVPDWVHISELVTYRQGSVPPDYLPYPKGDSPLDALIIFIEKDLQTSTDAVVVCENRTADRKTYKNWQWGTPPPVACYGDNEVYHMLRRADVGSEVIEDSIRQSQDQFGTGVCSSSTRVPAGDIPDESFFDEIVQNTRHIFIPAFDGDGYLIWSPSA